MSLKFSLVVPEYFTGSGMISLIIKLNGSLIPCVISLLILSNFTAEAERAKKKKEPWMHTIEEQNIMIVIDKCIDQQGYTF